MSTQVLESQPNATAQPKVKPDFGQGRYSALMQESFDDAQTIFGLTPEKSEKLARKIAAEIGAIMQSAPIELRLGKLPKKGDAKITISEACKVKGVQLTNTIYALKAMHFAGEAGMNGFSFALTKWSPLKGLQEFFTTL